MAMRLAMLGGVVLALMLTGTAPAEPAGPTQGSESRPGVRPVPALPGGGLDIPKDEAPFSTEPPDAVDDLGVEEPSPDADAIAAGPPPPVHYGLDGLPKPVVDTRAALVEAARSGDVDKLRPLIEKASPRPTLSTVDDGSDPIDVLRAEAGDEAGREILAIMLDILDAGWVVVDEGKPTQRYVWPYFARTAPDALTPPQMVELFRIVTAGDFEGMRGVGVYNFYRVEIGADGRWIAFMAGE